MKAGSLSPLATVATQTDPWSDDCRLSLLDGHYDDIGADDVSRHIYQLHAECSLPDAVPLYDYLQREGSETEDDGYDVIADDWWNDGTDAFDNSHRTTQPPSAHVVNGNSPSAISYHDLKRSSWTPLPKVPVSSFPDVPQRPSFSGEIAKVKNATPAKSQQSVIRLGVESRRDRRVLPLELVDNILSTHGVMSSRHACRGRLVPTMGTRLKAARLLHAVTGSGSSEPPCDAVLDRFMAPGSVSMSDGEQSASPITASPSRQTRSWSSDGDAPVNSFDHPLDVRCRSPIHVSTLSTSGTADVKAAMTSHPLPTETTACCSPVSVSSDDVSKMSPTETPRHSADDADSDGTPSTRRRFIYEHYADVMYTNQANLAHTIMVQQRLFQQLLADSNPSADCTQSNNSEMPLRAVCGDGTQSHRRRYRSRLAEDEHVRDVGKDIRESSCSKWVVRRRKDGTRYVTRSRHDNNETTNTEPKWRHHQVKVISSDEPTKEVSDKQLHANKHRRVSTSGREYGSPNANSRDERVNSADTALKTSTKAAQHHPILAVVTI